MDLLKALHKNPFVLAPMAGITDAPFRSFMKEMGCGIMTTELISATGLKFNSEKTKKLMAFSQDQQPVGVQLFGTDLKDLEYASKYIEDQGASFIDINLGCPVNKVVKKGAGSALLKDLKTLSGIFSCIKKAVNIPVTAKIRTGWDSQSRNSLEVATLAYNEGLTWVSIHGRTRAQGYSGLADWEYIKSVKKDSPIPIIGNGDIHTYQDAINYLNTSQCDAVMIGRGCLKNPWIFLEASKKQTLTRNFSQLFKTLAKHFEQYEERIQLLQIKKLSAWYSAGYRNSTEFRKEIFQIKEKQNLLNAVEQFFINMHEAPKDTRNENFLMGGHG
ncbi:MAG: tRNA dihydrouridine synthase DusB [Bdellovibrionaceae bacterium]|nr:tRNA dihydrouridine synthase DusB [Pseudobdellovibrionaceae bacterium]